MVFHGGTYNGTKNERPCQVRTHVFHVLSIINYPLMGYSTSFATSFTIAEPITRSDVRNLAPDAVMFPAGIPKHTLDGIFTGLTGRNLQELWFQMGLVSSGFLVYPRFRYVTQTSQGMKTGCAWFSLALSFRFFLACCTPSCVFKLLRVDVPI